MIDIRILLPHNRFMSTRQNIHSGFTITEIMIVSTLVVLLGLAILTTINPIAQIFKGYDARRKADLASIKIAFENYYSDHACYPSQDILKNCGSGDLHPYLNAIPCNPNGNVPYKVYLLPEDSICPQKYAIYAPIIAFFDKLSSSIPGCPDTMAVYSTDMTNTDIANGCGARPSCVIKYGCRSGVCEIVAQDVPAPCPNYSCDTDCGRSCLSTQGAPINECVIR